MMSQNPGMQNGGNINVTRVFQALVYRNAKTLVFPLTAGRVSELPFTNPTDSKFTVPIWGGAHTFLPIPEIGPVSNRLCLPWE
jgi:hypothetical protein